MEIYKVDIQKEPEIAKKYKVFAVPMLVYIKNNEVVKKERGVKSVKELTESVNKYLK